MSLKRRKLIQLLSLGALLPNQVLKALSGKSDRFVLDLPTNITDNIYDEAIVIDGLLIPRGWDEDSFAALAQSGYTGFNASLVSRNLNAALASMADWTKRIQEHPDKLLHAKTAEDFVRAKKENKVAVMYGFQNATMIEKSIDNIDVLI